MKSFSLLSLILKFVLLTRIIRELTGRARSHIYAPVSRLSIKSLQYTRNFICQNKVFGCRLDNALINQTIIGFIRKLMNSSV
jgi:hypothetical protein